MTVLDDRKALLSLYESGYGSQYSDWSARVQRLRDEIKSLSPAEQFSDLADQEALALKQEADQIALKKGMLESDTAVWASEDVYAQSVEGVNASVDAFNQKVGTYTEKAKAAAASAVTGSGLSLLLLIPVLIVFAVMYYRRR